MPSRSGPPLPRPVPRLERQVDGLLFSDWPGRYGPLVCLLDPLGSLPELDTALGKALAPDWRVISLIPPADVPYQAQAAQTLRLLDTFGFEGPVLLGSGLASGVALLLAAWYPTRLGGVVLVNAGLTRARRHQIAALAAVEPAWRAWLDTPPAWARLQAQVVCPMLRARTRRLSRAVRLTREFLDSAVQSGPWC